MICFYINQHQPVPLVCRLPCRSNFLPITSQTGWRWYNMFYIKIYRLPQFLWEINRPTFFTCSCFGGETHPSGDPLFLGSLTIQESGDSPHSSFVSCSLMKSFKPFDFQRATSSQHNILLYATSNKCHATSNKCLTSSNNKLLETISY